MRCAWLALIAIPTLGCASILGFEDGKQRGADADAAPANSDPAVDQISVAGVVGPGVDVSVSCTASDPDDDTLTFAITASDGLIVGEGADVTWQTSAAEGEETITCEVNDGRGGIASDTATSQVLVSDGLIAHYKFEGDVADSSASGLDLFVDSTQPTTSVPDRLGRTDGALSFGPNQSVGGARAVDGTGVTASNALTVSVWATFDSSASQKEAIIRTVENGSSVSYSLFVEIGGGLRWSYRDTLGTVPMIQIAPTVVREQFVHVAVTHAGTQIRGYVDGAEVLTQTVTEPLDIVVTATDAITVARVGQFDTFGVVDDARIYDRALTADEIAAIVAGSE